MNYNWRARLAAFICGLFALNAFASPEWLLTQQQTTGAIATSLDVATPVQSTAEAVQTLNALGQGANTAAARAYLAAETYDGTEYLARKIVAAADAAQPIQTLTSALLLHQNADGGFGEQPGYQSTAIDTAFALEALAASGASTQAVARAVAYLLQTQRSDGGWSLGNSASDAYTTAIVARSLHAHRSGFSGIAASVSSAANLLFSRRGADALWDEDLVSAQALLTLATIVADITSLQPSATGLRAHRLANTSWANDVYVTSVALRALHVFDARSGGASPPTTGGVVTGYVLRAGTSAPIENAVVTTAAGSQALTNSEGHFTVAGIAAGDVTLTISKGGYSPATRAVTVRNGQISSAGTVLLAQSIQEAIIQGRIVDAHDSTPLAGVSLTLSGPATATASSNAQGELEIANLPAGTYNVSFQRSGYYAVNGSLAIAAGSITSIQQALTRTGAFLDESPVDVAGRVIDGLSAAPIAGAAVTIDGRSVAVSASDGTFQLAALARGDHQLQISRVGYSTASYSFILPAGAAGSLGDLALFATTSDTAPTTLTLLGLVVNGLDNRPLSGASVRLVPTGGEAQTTEAGRFSLAGLTSLQHTIEIAAAGYETRTFALTASGFGEVTGTFALPPQGGDPDATTSTLRGVVRDSESSSPLANASVRIAGTSASAISGQDGAFEITGVSIKEFALSASLSGYSERRYDVELTQHGNYAIDVELTRAPAEIGDLFDVVSVVATQSDTGANTQQRFVARVANISEEPRTALVLADVFDAADSLVATTTPFAVGTEVPTTVFGFAAGEVVDIEIPWNTAQFAPGTYRLRVRVVEQGTVTRDLPTGVVLAQGEGLGSVAATLAIGGGLALDPPLAQAGASTPVRLSALLMNQGNLPLTGETFTLTILDPDSGAALHTAQAAADLLDVGDNTTLDFGTWIPTRAGDLPVTVVAQSANTTGIVNGVLYVGDKATGAFTVDRSVVPMGTQTVRASIAMRGVDVRTGTSTDPLFLAVKEAVRKGGIYVAQQAPAWNEQNRCLGCHTQTQSIMGLAASLDKVEVDRNALQYLYNDIIGSQQENGALHATHPQHASVQNALAMWSMSAWQDARQVFRTMYKAASFQLGRVSTSGNESSWGSDHCGAWWCNNEGPTMAATKGLAGVLRMASELGDQPVLDYSLQASHELGSANLMDFELGADGRLWYVEYAGGLYSRDLQTGERRTVATGIANAYGLAVRDDNVAYVTSGSRIVRVAADGTRTDLVNVGSGNLLDILIGPDGFLYVSDFLNHRILKVSQAGAVTVFASGGLLSQPVGLVFDPQGDLYVANYGRFNIVRIAPNGTASQFARGLPYRPVWLRRAADGTFYANSEGYNNSGFTPSGIWHIQSNGSVERIATMTSTNLYSYSGFNFIGNELYVSHESSRRLYRVVSQPLATPQLANIPEVLARVARYTIAHQTENTQYNDRHAMRLITLAEARPYITDTALQAQIDTAITNIATLLRQRQRADGGWAYIVSRTTSDPYATAFVGLALEYTHPSVNDPAIRNSITYLLNQQQTDFSWLYQTGVFPTKLGPTSFVMAYLPLALDRLGGIDTDLSVVMPSNVVLANPSQAPTSQTPVAAGTRYKWSLQGVTNNARTISFDATLADLGYQEERAVAAEAHLEFKNSFTDETLRSDLAIPKVRAASDLALTLSTDRTQYGAQSDVAINSVVTNVGQPIASGEVRLIIRAADGTVVATLGSMPVGAIATGGSLTLPSAWNTGTLLAGGYEVYGQLYNQALVLVSEAAASFQLAHAGSATAASVTTDRPIYQAWDAVALTGRVRNVSQNVMQPASIAELNVRNPSGQVIFTRSVALAEQAPLSLRDVVATLSLSDAVAGDYSVELTVLDSFSHALLASANGQFQVQRDEMQALRGLVSVQRTRIDRGAVNVCTDSVTNAAASGHSGVVLTQSLVNIETGETLQSSQLTRDFTGGQQHVLMRSVSTADLSLGSYACVLTATYQNITRQLGAAGFEVIAPPIRLDATLTTEGRGRLLVLMDDTGHWPCTALRDIELWAPFRMRLPSDARIDVELLDSEDRRVDFESVALSSYRGTVNQRRGASADLSITGVSADVLTVKIASASGLGTGYRMVAKVQAQSLPPITVESNVMGGDCGWHAGHGARFGDFHCSGGHTRNGGRLPAALAGVPTLAQQREFLEQQLDLAGWSYTIVTDDEAFERELRTGAYSQYALFAEHEKLDEQVQKELREAVNRGEGLLDAGQHDQRHHGFDVALGIKPVGRHSKAKSVTITADWTEAGTATLAAGSEAMRIRLAGAQKIANFNLSYGGGHGSHDYSTLTSGGGHGGGGHDHGGGDHDDDCDHDGGHGGGGHHIDDTAATYYTYGRGKSVYVGYDLLEQATLAGANSLHAALLRDALVQVAPVVSPNPRVGEVIPLRLTVHNEGVATPGRAVLQLPAGVTLVDGVDAEVSNGTLTWNFELAASQQQVFTAWVRLPNTEGAVQFDALIQSGSTSYVDQTHALLTVNANSRATLADARALSQTSIRFLPVKLWLDQAQFWLQRNRADFALASLVRASSEAMQVSHAQAAQLRLHIDDVIWTVGRQGQVE